MPGKFQLRKFSSMWRENIPNELSHKLAKWILVQIVGGCSIHGEAKAHTEKEGGREREKERKRGNSA